MNTPIHDRINESLVNRRSEHMFRTIPKIAQEHAIDLSTNSYLSLHDIQEIHESAKELTNGFFAGNGASRLVAVSTSLFDTLEQELSSWKQTESSLVFNSGYAANIGIIQAICTRDTEVFSDRLNHASIIDGIKLSGCKMIRYKHNDMTDLKLRLSKSISKEKLIITDTVFSMDGDRANLIDICDLAKKFNGMVMIDEAHATGIFGNKGSGLAEEQGVSEHIDIRMGTLSKAINGVGGFYCGSAMIRDFLINFSRSFIYSTALPKSSLAYTIAAIRYIRMHPERGSLLLQKSDSFRTKLQALGFDTMNSTTQIIPLKCLNESDAVECASYLKNAMISVPAIRPPTVPLGTSRLRFSLHSGLTDENLLFVLDTLKKWKDHSDN